MVGSLLGLVCLALAADPCRQTIPARMFCLPSDAGYLRIMDRQIYLSGFYIGKLVNLPASGKKQGKELWLDTYEANPTGPNKIREVRHASGGDLVVVNGKIFVGQVFQGSILVVDQATFKPVKRLKIGGEGCLAASRDGKLVFFASNLKPEFYIIDTQTYQYRSVPYPAGGHGIGCLALAPDGKRLWLGIQRSSKKINGQPPGGGNSFLAVYDLAKKNYAGTIFLGLVRPDGTGDDGLPTALAFSPDAKRLYVGMFQYEAGLLVVDTQKLQLISNIYFGSRQQIPPFPWVDPFKVAVFDRWLLVSVRHNQEVAVVERTTHHVVARIRHQEPVAFDHLLVDGNRIFLVTSSSRVSRIRSVDLSRLLAEVDLKKVGPLQLTLKKR